MCKNKPKTFDFSTLQPWLQHDDPDFNPAATAAFVRHATLLAPGHNRDKQPPSSSEGREKPQGFFEGTAVCVARIMSPSPVPGSRCCGPAAMLLRKQLSSVSRSAPARPPAASCCTQPSTSRSTADQSESAKRSSSSCCCCCSNASKTANAGTAGRLRRGTRIALKCAKGTKVHTREDDSLGDARHSRRAELSLGVSRHPAALLVLT